MYDYIKFAEDQYSVGYFNNYGFWEEIVRCNEEYKAVEKVYQINSFCTVD